MTKTAFREALSRLSLTQGQAADLLGYTIKSVNDWANGRQPVPLLVGIALENWLRHGLPKT